MQVAQTIDVTAPDQGLKQILEMAQCQPDLCKYVTTNCEMGTVKDLLGYFAEATFEVEIKELVTGRFKVAEAAAAADGQPAVQEFKVETQRLYISRLRAAYKLAADTDKRIRADAAKPPTPRDEDIPDLERPLDPASVERLETEWNTMHHMKLINFMKPAPQFRNKLFRELHMKTARLVPVEKVRSLEDNRLASEPEKLDIGAVTGEGSKLVLETTRKSTRRIADCLEYLTALRILMQTYAYCGSHKVTASEDSNKQVIFFPLETAIGYVDEVTAATLSMHTLTELERLIWLRRRDEQVRGEMVALVNDGFSGGEALTTSWKKLAHIWVIRDGASSSDGQDGGRRGQVRQRQEDKGKGGGKGGKAKAAKGAPYFKRASVDKKTGKKLCGAYNGFRGCVWNEKQCPQQGRHVCNVIMPSGEICGSREHGASNHS